MEKEQEQEKDEHIFLKILRVIIILFLLFLVISLLSYAWEFYLPEGVKVSIVLLGSIIIVIGMIIKFIGVVYKVLFRPFFRWLFKPFN